MIHRIYSTMNVRFQLGILSTFEVKVFVSPSMMETSQSSYSPKFEDDNYDYTEDDMLDGEVLFGTCDIESKLYTNCLRDARTQRRKGWRKYWYPEWTLTKKDCQKESFDLDMYLKVQWRQKLHNKHVII